MEGSSQKKLLLPWVINMRQKERKEKKKEINQSKIGGKQKKNKKEKNTESFFGPDNVWTMCGIVKSKRKKIVMVAWLKPEGFMKQSPS